MPSHNHSRSAAAGALAALLALLVGCTASTHPTQTSQLGKAVSSDEMLTALETPGPVHFERVIAADWAVDRAGLIDLDHERAKAAGLEAGDEPIQVFFYVLTHPRFGNFLVDTGVEAGFLEDSNPRVSRLVASAMNTAALVVHTTTGAWLRDNDVALSGVFLTHTHLDHVMGLPDIDAAVPVYAGPGEPGARNWLYAFTRGTIDGMLAGSGPLQEWAFAEDASGRFDGVLDIFGDGSVFALHVPGHTPGSTAFVVRTPEGPKLLVGDASHTAWGWENAVPPGTVSYDRPRSVGSLAALRQLSELVPGLEVHLGHQESRAHEETAARVAAALSR